MCVCVSSNNFYKIILNSVFFYHNNILLPHNHACWSAGGLGFFAGHHNVVSTEF